MATTSPELATDLLRAFTREGIDYALLHGAAQLQARGPISDVDVVIGNVPKVSVPVAIRIAGAVGLYPVAVWKYDVGACTLFLVTDAMEQSVQLDLLYDPHGRGKYGLRSPALLGGAYTENGLSMVSQVDETLYLLRKRIVKRDFNRAHQARVALSSHNRSAVDKRIKDVFDRHVAHLVRRFLDESQATVSLPEVVSRPMSTASRVRWIIDRVVAPAGVTVGPLPADLAQVVASRLMRGLPRVEVINNDQLCLRVRAEATKRRAGAVVLVGSSDRTHRSSSDEEPTEARVAALRATLSSYIWKRWGADVKSPQGYSQ